MKIEINIPTNRKDELIEAFASTYGYRDKIGNPDHDSEEKGSQEEIPNPQTKAQFAKEQVVKFVKEVYIGYKVKTFDEGKNEVRTTAKTEAEDIN